MEDFVKCFAKSAAVGDGSPFSSATPGSKPAAAPATPKPAPAIKPVSPSVAPIPQPKTQSSVPVPPGITPAPAPDTKVPVLGAAPRPSAANTKVPTLGTAPAPSASTPKATPVGTPPVSTPPPAKPAVPAPPASPLTAAPAPRPVEPEFPTPTPPATPTAKTGPDMTKFFESMAPHLMKQIAPSMGAVGGMPLLMMLWDLMGGSHGKNIKTIFGDRGQPGSETAADLGAAAATPPGAGPAIAPEPRAATPRPEVAPAPHSPAPTPAAASVPSGPIGRGVDPRVEQEALPPFPAGAIPTGPATPYTPPPGYEVPPDFPPGADFGSPEPNTGPSNYEVPPQYPEGTTLQPPADTGGDMGGDMGAAAATPVPPGFNTGTPDFEEVRKTLAEHFGKQTTEITDDQVKENYGAFAQSLSGGGTGGTASPAADPNWMQRYRKWNRDVTKSGTPVSPKIQADAGNLTADLGAGLGINAAVNAGAKKLTGARPGFMPVNLGLDALDAVGLNPTSDRFGKGTLGTQESLRGAEDLAGENLPWGMARSLLQPVTTAHQVGTLGGDAARQVSELPGTQDATNRMAADLAKRTGQAPAVAPTNPSEFHYSRNPDGSARELDASEKWQKILDKGKAYDASSPSLAMPGAGYLSAFAESGLDGAAGTLDGFKQKNNYRQHLQDQEAKLRAEAAQATDTINRRQAEMELEKVRKRQALAEPDRTENVYNNVTEGSVATPGEIIRGEFRWPWQKK